MLRRSLCAVALTGAALLVGRPVSAQPVHDLPGEDRYLGGEATDIFSVGGIAGDEWETLSGIRAVDFDEQGNLYVLDGNARVLRFGPDGRFLNQIGREGPGPGEINLGLTMVVRPGGRVVVLDPSRGYHVFEADGAYVETIHPVQGVFANRVILSDERLILAGGHLAARLFGTNGAPVLRQQFTSGAPPTVLFESPRPVGQPSLGSSDGSTSRWPPLLTPALHIARGDRDLVAVASGTAWRIDVVDGKGGRRGVIRRPLSARPTTAGDRKALEARDDSEVRVFGNARVRPVPMNDVETAVADSVPVIRDIRGNGHGILLVGRETTPVGLDAQDIDIVTTDGEYVGTLRDKSLPEAIGPDNLAAYVERDELGVERVVVRRLPDEWVR